MTTSSPTAISLEWEPAYEDGGSPILNYVLEMDEVEGIGVSNIEDWQPVFTGAALEYTVTSGVGSVVLTPTLKYRFRVQAISEYAKESPYSKVSSFYAAALPDSVTFPAEPFVEMAQTKLKFEWHQPAIDGASELAIHSYRVYWDAGYV
jgi:hypothetical protein